MKKVTGLLLATFLLTSVAQANPKTHVVEKGDTLYGIAKQHSLSIEQVKQWNGLSSDQIKIGQELTLLNGVGKGSSPQSMTSKGTSTSKSSSTKATVIVDQLNLREKGELSGKIVGSLKRGTVVEIMESGEFWSLVQVGNQKGYVSTNYVQSGLPQGISSRSQDLIESRLQNVINPLIGTPYKTGGTSPEGFDCSGFTVYVMKQLGVKLPRVSEDQFGVGTAVDRDNLQAGDLLFFDSYGSGKITHVSVYLGNNRIAHSATTQVVVEDATWYFNNYPYYGAKRVIN